MSKSILQLHRREDHNAARRSRVSDEIAQWLERVGAGEGTRLSQSPYLKFGIFRGWLFVSSPQENSPNVALQ